MSKKVIVISGGSDGLGKEIARLVAGSHTVVMLAKTEEKLKNAASEIGCDFVAADVSDYAAVESAVAKVMEKYGRIDVVVNNAGIWIEGELEGNGPARIEEVFAVNTLGTIYLSKAVVPFMKAQKSGQIINVISQAGLYAKKERSVYHASKWAITGFTKSIEQELSKYGIRVSGVYPGKIKTGLFAKAGVDKDMGNAVGVEPVAKTVQFVIDADEDVVIPELGVKVIGG